MDKRTENFVESQQLVEEIQSFCERYLLDGLNQAREEGASFAVGIYALLECVRLIVSQHVDDTEEGIAFFEELAQGFIGDWRNGSRLQ